MEQNDTMREVKAVVEHSSKAPPTYAPEIPWLLLLHLCNATAVSSHILLSRENMKNAHPKSNVSLPLPLSLPVHSAAISMQTVELDRIDHQFQPVRLRTGGANRNQRRRTLENPALVTKQRSVRRGRPTHNNLDGEHQKNDITEAKSCLWYFRISS